MIKLTRLNRQIVAVNPDHVYAVEATPDTTLRLVGGEMIIVRETLDELIERVTEFRSSIRARALGGVTEGDGCAAVLTAGRHDGDGVLHLTNRHGEV